MVDSSVWIDFFNGRQTPQTDYLDTALGQQAIVTGDLILTEVLQGFRHQQEFEQARSALLKLSMAGQRIAIQSAVNYRALRARGITICKTMDCLIATFCIENGIVLLHTDRDLEPFESYLNLQVLHP